MSDLYQAIVGEKFYINFYFIYKEMNHYQLITIGDDLT